MEDFKENPELALTRLKEINDNEIVASISADDIKRHLKLVDKSKHSKLTDALRSRISESLTENLENFWVAMDVTEKLKKMKELEEKADPSVRRTKVEPLDINSRKADQLVKQKEVLKRNIAKIQEENQNLKKEIYNFGIKLRQDTHCIENFNFA